MELLFASLVNKRKVVKCALNDQIRKDNCTRGVVLMYTFKNKLWNNWSALCMNRYWRTIVPRCVSQIDLFSQMNISLNRQTVNRVLNEHASKENCSGGVFPIFVVCFFNAIARHWKIGKCDLREQLFKEKCVSCFFKRCIVYRKN